VKQHEEALAREKIAIDYRITMEPREHELQKLTTRVQELETSVDAANQRAARFEELLHSDARYAASTAGSSVRIASLEAELFNAEKQTQLARSRERATSETHRELEDRILKLEAQVVSQVQRIQELTVSETELKNQLVGTTSRDEAKQQEMHLATLKEEISRIGVELTKYKELASIAAAQSVTISTNVESSANELALLRAATRDLQAKGDQEHLLGELYQRVAALQMSEASSQHKADHYRTEYQRLSLSHHKLMQRVDEFLNKYFSDKEQYRAVIQANHQRMDDSGAQVCHFIVKTTLLQALLGRAKVA
jgi:chromosome segregation ATPase